MDTTASGKQATLEDLVEWRHTTDHWVKRSCSTETNDAICPSWFYLEFRKLCGQTIAIKESSLVEFLQSHFPDFELVLSADNNVLLTDSVYVCSLLLYFSCVRYPVAYLRNVCKQFNELQQQRIKTFFKPFLTGSKINRGFLDCAIVNAVRSTPLAMQTGQCPKWDNAPVIPDSPHELHYKNKNLDRQLQTALAENASLEKQNEQLQSQLLDLSEKNKRLVVRLEVLEETGSDRERNEQTPKEITDFDAVCLRKQLIEKDKQLEHLEAEVCRLKTTEESFKKDQDRLGFENKALQEEITHLQTRLEAATALCEKGEGDNRLLRDQLMEFQRYIDGNRMVLSSEILDSSNDFLNMSLNTSLNQSCSPDGESLASSVVEVMLQEAKTQNQQLQSRLNQLEEELKLTKEQNRATIEINNRLGQQTLLVQTEMIDLQARHDMVLKTEKSEAAKLRIALKEKCEQNMEHLQKVENLHKEKEELLRKIEEIGSTMVKEKLNSAEWKSKLDKIESDHRQQVENFQKEKERLLKEIEELSAALETEKMSSAEWKSKWEENDSDHRQKDELSQKEKERLLIEIEELSAALETEKMSSAEWKSKLEENDSDHRQKDELSQKEKERLHKEIGELSAALETEKMSSAEWKSKLEENDFGHRQKVELFQKEKERLLKEIGELSVAFETVKVSSAEWKSKLEERDSDHRQKVDLYQKENERLLKEIEELSVSLETEKMSSAEWKSKLEENDSDHRQKVELSRKEKERLLKEIGELSAALEAEKMSSAEWKSKLEERDSDHRQKIELSQNEKERLHKEIEELSVSLETEKVSSAEWKSKLEEKDSDYHQKVTYFQKEMEGLLEEIENLTSALEKEKSASAESRDNAHCMPVSTYVQQIEVLKEERDKQAKQLEEQKSKYVKIEEEFERAIVEAKKLPIVLERQKGIEIEYDRKISDLEGKIKKLYTSLESSNAHNTQLLINLDEREERLQEYEQQINHLQSKLADVESQCINLMNQHSVQKNEIFEKTRKNDELSDNLTILKKEMQHMQEMLARSKKTVEQVEGNLPQSPSHFSNTDIQKSAELIKELQDKNEKYYNDCEILSAKLYMERVANEKWKEEMIAIRESYDQEKRVTRISYEESMEKMKERMKKLHKDSKDALEHNYKEKLTQLELRCAQLQEQLAEKNERDLAIRKENQVLQAKVKTLEENKSERNGRFLLPAQACLRDNLRMEDEEGELFNATYLADLQNGRCWSPGADTVRYSELLQRNSMVPPHLRTNYDTMYPDCDAAASDTPDSVSEGFDDSSTGLITHRKVSGTTSYKRPGPPTPSKKASRVSFGGILPITNNQVQYKEALKSRNSNFAGSSSVTSTSHNNSDPLLNDAKTVGRTKTPGKFKQMLSSSNLLGNFNQRNEVTKKNFFPYYI
ncbi:interaptin-like isoform X1 [Anopheles albimanus]|uniref:interaptin-like isoform X1 n=1 Tax=Anopheles albimanus TaxID=7167 RepID=UPI001641EC16|nr:interaptin-like isoform X1 [Anopheles albimanus]